MREITATEYLQAANSIVGDAIELLAKGKVKEKKKPAKITWRIQTVKGGKFALVNAGRTSWDDEDFAKYYAPNGYRPVTSFGAKRFDTRDEAQAYAIDKKLNLGVNSSRPRLTRAQKLSAV